MQVGVDVLCMYANFSGCGFYFCFFLFSFKKWPNFFRHLSLFLSHPIIVLIDSFALVTKN